VNETDDSTAVDLRGPLPPGFTRRVVKIPSGKHVEFEPVDWHDAIVSIERGAIELEGLTGHRYPHAAGDLVSLSGLPLRAIHAHGPDDVVLLAVARTNPSNNMGRDR
jgi:hypothetical protein